ncbi:MAG: GDP-mannose 4,6-dehydratase, partial [Candidatus Odinarchaeota archaeon]
KSIIITGAAGFIGSHLTEKLLKNSNFLILIDNFNEYYLGKEERLAKILENYQSKKDYILIREDLTNNTFIDQIHNEIDIIFHLAAQAGVRYSINKAADVSKNNIISTVNIFEYALKFDKIQKILYASSSSVYGNPIYTPCDENHPKNPISPYAVSKLCGELYADYYYREYNLPITTLRFYTVYGPRGRPDMSITKFFNLIFNDQEISIYGDGQQLRDFTYISDIINGLILACEKDVSNGEIFNLGCSNPISVNDLIEKMYNITKKPKKVKFVDKQQGDVDITYSNINKAKSLLNYNPEIDIDKGLINHYNWQIKEFSK